MKVIYDKTTDELDQNPDQVVVVCSACGTASCWHGDFYCDESRGADIEKTTRGVLDTKGLEHPSHYSDEKLFKIYGTLDI